MSGKLYSRIQHHLNQHKLYHSTRRLLTFPPGAMIGLILCLTIITTILFGYGAYADTHYSITYDSNVVSNMPVDTSSESFSETVPISDATPTRPGYSFLGWCTTAPAANTPDTCSGTTYSPSSNWTINQTSNANSLRLFAMWAEICLGYTIMQDLTSSNISTLLPSIGSTATVCDVRDETKYTIGKLADEKYWMLDNLALDLYDTNVLNSLSSANTNIEQANEANILTSLRSGNRTAGNQYSTAGLTAWPFSSSSYSVPMADLSHIELPSDYNSSSDPIKDTVIENSWKIGGYYNYCAATAGSYCYGGSTSAGTSSGDATSDICPKGWRLPTSNGGETNTLYSAYRSGASSQYTAYMNYRTALHLPLSGYFYNGSAGNQGSDGNWWSSTRNENDYMYGPYASTSYIIPATNTFRNRGFSIRCILNS